MLCKYAHIFGKENEGVHAIRVFDIAIIDLLLTILASWLVAKYTKTNIILVFIALLLVAIIMHRLFCVNTTINKYIFGVVKQNSQ